MSIVYVVQNQHRLDASTQRLVPAFDLRPAERFGRLVYLLGPGANPFGDLDAMVDDMRRILFGYTDKDYLLLVGNPVLIGCAVSVASSSGSGKVNLLQWSGKRRCYLPISVNL